MLKFLRSYIQVIVWLFFNFTTHSPRVIKQKVIRQNLFSHGTFIETGTHKGDTAKYVSRYTNQVITIEPSIYLYRYCQKKLKKKENIKLFNLTSKQFFNHKLIIDGDVCFWLDGHHSGQGTYLADELTPIRFELEWIQSNLNKFNQVVILVDDFALFGNQDKYGSYPPKSYLINWANRNSFDWTVEHNIFIAKNAYV